MNSNSFQLHMATVPVLDQIIRDGARRALQAAIEDINGLVITSNTSMVTLTLASGPTASLSGTLAMAAVAGVATFSNLSLNAGGSFTLGATDGNDALATSQSFYITVPVLQVQHQPFNVTVGQTFSPAVVVDIDNPNFTLITSDDSTVALSILSGPSGATLGGTLSVAAVGGVATFGNLSLTVPGTYALQATDGLDTAGAFAPMTVAYPHLVFTQQPTGTTTGTVISPAVTVAVEDANNATMTANTSTIALSIASGPGGAVFGGTFSVAAVNGVATFSNLMLSKNGPYAFTATDGIFTAATSATFYIGTHLVFANQPSNVLVNGVLAPAVTVDVENPNNSIITSDSSTVTLSIAAGPGSAVLGGSLSAAAVNGVATFSNLSLNLPGTYTLQAADGTDTAATSGSFSIVNPQLVFAQQPTNAAAGSSVAPAVKVDVEGFNQQVIANDSSSVTLAIASGPGGATLDGTLTVAAINGVATFGNLDLTLVGTYTLTATDGSDTSATSSNFTVAAGAAAALQFVQQPTNSIAGVAVSPALTLDILDNFGNLCTTNTSAVFFSVGSGPAGGSLSGTTAVHAVGGVVTFSNVLSDMAGAYTIGASDGLLRLATSGTFTISAASAVGIGFVTPPSNVASGIDIGPAITVQVVDGFGNSEPNGTPVTLSLAAAPAGTTLGGTATVDIASGLATFSDITLTEVGAYTLTATAGSLSTTSDTFTVKHGKAAGLDFIKQPGSFKAGVGNTTPITVDVVDANGNLIPGSTAPVTLTVASGPTKGKILTTATTNAVAGVATFMGISFNKAGGYTLSATSGTFTDATSGSFTVTHAAAGKLVFVQQPTNTTAGVAVAPGITVNVADAYGNLCNTNTSTVKLSILAGPFGAPLGGTISAAAVAGTATFSNILLTTAGVYTLSASDGLFTTAASGSFAVTAGAADKLKFAVQPGTVAKNVHIAPAVVVKVKDIFGNLVTTDTSAITLSLLTDPTGATLGGTLTLNAIGGMATFSNLTLSKNGTYTLQATDGSLIVADSIPFVA